MTVPRVKSIELSPGAKYLVIGLGCFTLGLALGLTVSALNQPSETLVTLAAHVGTVDVSDLDDVPSFLLDDAEKPD